jgi:hypothetical protein
VRRRCPVTQRTMTRVCGLTVKVHYDWCAYCGGTEELPCQFSGEYTNVREPEPRTSSPSRMVDEDRSEHQSTEAQLNAGPGSWIKRLTLKAFGLLESDREGNFTPTIGNLMVWTHPTDSRFVVLRNIVSVHEWLKEVGSPPNAMICLPAK